MVSEVYNRLKAALPPGTPLFLGLRHLAEHATPPRLVLAPVADTYGPAGGGGLVASVEAEFELVIWGRDFDEVEGAIEELATAFDTAFGSAATLRTGSWAGPEERVSELGVLYRLRFSVKGQLERAASTATLETIAQACAGTF